MDNIDAGLKMMIYGMGTTFTILIIFYFLIKFLAIIFPKR